MMNLLQSINIKKWYKKMGISFANLLLIALIVLIVFGAGKLPSVMGDIGKGIKNFKKNVKDDTQGKQLLSDKVTEEQKHNEVESHFCC